MYLGNLFIYLLISEITSDLSNLDKNPLYIHFINAPCNSIPDFLAHRRELGIVIQKQFQNLVIDYRGLGVVLYFDGKPYTIYIDLSTIYSVEAINKIKIEMDNRITKEYYASILSNNEDEYMLQMKEMVMKMNKYDKDIIKLFPRVKMENNKKVTIYEIGDIIKPTRK